MKPITIEGLTEAEIDELASTAPEGVTVNKLKLTLLDVSSPDAVMVAIECARDVGSTLLAAWLWDVLSRRRKLPSGKQSERIKINRQDVILEAGEVRRVVTEQVRIQRDRGRVDN